jgi:hypothetical protein
MRCEPASAQQSVPLTLDLSSESPRSVSCDLALHRGGQIATASVVVMSQRRGLRSSPTVASLAQQSAEH